MSTLASLKSSLNNRVHTIEVLLGTMTTPVQNQDQEIVRTEQIKKINELMSEANTNLMNIEAEHRDDIETSELATFRTALTIIKGKASTHNLANLKSGLQGRIYTIEVLLGLMTTPVLNLAQEFEHTRYTKRIDDLTFKANTILLDIKAKHGSNIDPTKLAALRTYLTNRI